MWPRNTYQATEITLISVNAPHFSVFEESLQISMQFYWFMWYWPKISGFKPDFKPRACQATDENVKPRDCQATRCQTTRLCRENRSGLWNIRIEPLFQLLGLSTRTCCSDVSHETSVSVKSQINNILRKSENEYSHKPYFCKQSLVKKIQSTIKTHYDFAWCFW